MTSSSVGVVAIETHPAPAAITTPAAETGTSLVWVLDQARIARPPSRQATSRRRSTRADRPLPNVNRTNCAVATGGPQAAGLR